MTSSPVTIKIEPEDISDDNINNLDSIHEFTSIKSEPPDTTETFEFVNTDIKTEYFEIKDEYDDDNEIDKLCSQEIEIKVDVDARQTYIFDNNDETKNSSLIKRVYCKSSSKRSKKELVAVGEPTEMPRNKLLHQTPMRSVRRWEQESMVKAVKAVRSKEMGLKKASKIFKVPKSTLKRYANAVNKTSEEVVVTKLGRKPIFPPELENELVYYLQELERIFFGFTRKDVCRIAYQLAIRNNLDHSFNYEKERAGRAWYNLFIRRHRKELSMRTPTNTSVARKNGFTKEAVEIFFNLLTEVMEKFQFPATRIYNVDETGISIVPNGKRIKIVGKKGKRLISSLTAAERGSLVTVVCCMSASGNFVPPMLIFPRKNYSVLLEKGAPPGTIVRVHPSGWIQLNLFTEWFQHFIKITNPTSESPILLILDGHYSHTRNIDVIKLARENHVVIISLPPNATHKLQPLDRSYMSSFKAHYSEAIRMFIQQYARAPTQYDLTELFGTAYIESQRASIAINGFKVTGIFPLNRNIFTEDEFIVEKSKQGSQQESSHDIEIEAGEVANNFSVNTVDTPNTDRVMIPAQVNHDIEPTNKSTPSTEPTKMVSPEDIMPIPSLQRKISTRGRKATQSSFISGSPYKNLLENTLKKNESQPQPSCSGISVKASAKGRSTARGQNRDRKCGRGRPRRQLNNDSSVSIPSSNTVDLDLPPGETGPTLEDAECIFCNGTYLSDRPGELWIQCLMCESWAHTACTDCEKETYVCDYCK